MADLQAQAEVEGFSQCPLKVHWHSVRLYSIDGDVDEAGEAP